MPLAPTTTSPTPPLSPSSPTSATSPNNHGQQHHHIEFTTAAAAQDEFDNDATFGRKPRRQSTLSNISDFGSEVREALNPHPPGEDAVSMAREPALGGWGTLAIAFPFLPALAGLMFENGHHIAMDMMLLMLGAKFLHFTVTQPW
jgi:hypothetical protein